MYGTQVRRGGGGGAFLGVKGVAVGRGILVDCSYRR